MQDLIDKIEQLKKSLAAMKPKENVLVPALKLPSVKPLSISSSSGGGAVKAKLPGVAPVSGKDPKKMAEQLKNPRPKKAKVEVLKTDKNGQWSLEKTSSSHDVLTGAGFKLSHPNHQNPDLRHVYERKTPHGHNEFISLNTHDGKWQHQAKPGMGNPTTSFSSVHEAVSHANNKTMKKFGEGNSV